MSAEEWKPILEVPGYEVSSEGNIRNAKGKLRKLAPATSGYTQVALYHPTKGKYIMRLVHRLVAEAFIPNPRGLPQVNHLDHGRSNNKSSNLEWVDAKTNSGARRAHNHRTRERAIIQSTLEGEVVQEWESTKAAAAALQVTRGQIQACLRGRQKTSRGFLWKYKDSALDPQEQWRSVTEREVSWSVSSLGRVRMPKTGVVSYGILTNDGYREVTMNGVHFLVHRLVALAFRSQAPGKPIVNHLDGDRQNNAASNLEWASHQENIKHAVLLGRMRQTAVDAVLSDGTIEHYGSIAEAASATGITASNISRCIRGGMTAGGYVWVQAEPTLSSEPLQGLAQTTEDDGPSWEAQGFAIATELGPTRDENSGPSEVEENLAKPKDTLVIFDDDPFWAELGL